MSLSWRNIAITLTTRSKLFLGKAQRHQIVGHIANLNVGYQVEEVTP